MDSQKQKVYNAEKAAEIQKYVIEDYQEIQKFVNRIYKYRWFQRRFGTIRKPPEVVKGRRNGWARAINVWGGYNLVIPEWAKHKLVILHEMAHCITPRASGHDWKFCNNFLTLVYFELGREDYLKLKNKFKEFRVKYKEPRKKGKCSEAQLAVLARGRAKLMGVVNEQNSGVPELVTG